MEAKQSYRLRWGIIGLGSIASKFAEGLSHAPGAELAAVGSRSLEKAKAFGAKHSAARCYGTYEDLVSDPEVDAVYVATPHSQHLQAGLLCLGAGKGVLCEKPFTINFFEAEKLVQTARANKLFLMEAMWTRFFPLMVQLRELVKTGEIGEPRMLLADFGFRSAVNPGSRLFDPERGGGALLDVGIYPISLASMLLGTPNRITGIANIGTTGVDEEAAVVLGSPGGKIAVLAAGIRISTPQQAVILGTEGSITVHSQFWHPAKMTIVNGGKSRDIDIPYEGNGYQYEAIEVARCMSEQLLESPIMPLDESLHIMQTLDSLRQQWGLKYPME